MGRQIDQQESPEGSGKPRRISLPEVIIQVLIVKCTNFPLEVTVESPNISESHE